MAVLNQRITGKVSGDTIRLTRTYTGLPTGITFSKVYLTVKAAETDADGSATVQKSITTSSAAAGQITDASTSDGTIGFYVVISSSESATMAPGATYYYDLQGITSGSEVYTFEIGEIVLERGRTDATS